MDLYRHWIKREYSIWRVAQENGLRPRKKIPYWAIAASVTILLIGSELFFRLSGKDRRDDFEPRFSSEKSQIQEDSVIRIDTFQITEQETKLSDTHKYEKVEAVFYEKGDEKAGSIYISSNPFGALISIDGKNTGLNTPDLIENIPIGIHELMLTYDGFKPEKAAIKIYSDKVDTKSFQLTKSTGNILLDIKTTSKAYLDGMYLVNTPYLKPIKIQTGKHELIFTNEKLGFKQSILFELSEGEERIISQDLQE